MTVYQAVQACVVHTPSGDVEVPAGTLVQFAHNPGSDWEEVTSGDSDTGPQGGAMGSKRKRHGDNQGAV
jgi:hypothetical protein